MTSCEDERALRLLALDGGGIRGLSELLIIKEIMYCFQREENGRRRKEGREPLKDLPKPCQFFDLIGGTSTGGIIALMLGRLRMDVDKAIDCYRKLAAEVFSKPKRWGGNGLFSATKLEDAIKLIVKEELGDSESPLLEDENSFICRTFVCAKNTRSLNIPVILRSYKSSETPIDCMVWQAARATFAAPLFFKHIEIGRGQLYIDGGIGVNNPTSTLLTEASTLFPNRKIGCLLSIGTGHRKPAEILTSRLFQPKRVTEALERIATDCDATHQDVYRRFANSRNIYFRLNVDQGMQDIKLSEWERLSEVETHTIQYMKDGLVKDILSTIAEKIRNPQGELTASQIISPVPTLLNRGPSTRRKEKVWQFPHSVPTFTGRREIIDKIHSYFRSDNNPQRVFVLHGLGGSGKTQIALKFLEESEESAQFSNIFYVDATNEQTIVSYLTAITPDGIGESVNASLSWLAGRPRWNWLLFFDNADDVRLNLSQYFPQCHHGSILVTTRNRELRVLSIGDGADEQVKDMMQDDAINLLFRRSGKDHVAGNEDMAECIVKARICSFLLHIELWADALWQDLHCFALAVAQAGAYIKSRMISLEHFWELLSEQRDHLLQHQDIQGTDPAVYATWRLSFEQLDEPAQVFLQICSLLHHEGISEEIFKRASMCQLHLDDPEFETSVRDLLTLLGKQDLGWNSWVFQKIVDSLSSYSMIEFDGHNRLYSIHSLVQDWAHNTLGNKKQYICREVASILAMSVPNGQGYIFEHILLPHMLRIMKLVTPQEVSVHVGYMIGYIFSEHGYWKEAEALRVVGVEWRKENLGDGHPDTLGSIGSLAIAYKKQGQWKEAEALEVVVMQKLKKRLGEDHPDTLWAMGNLAVTYRYLGQWKEAEALQTVVFQKRKERLGMDHFDTLDIMGNLASTYKDQGQWKDAEELEVVVLEKRKEMLGVDDPDTLDGMENLAITYGSQGKWKEAEALDILVLEKRKERLGEDHPDTLISIGNLANTYRLRGQWKEAEALEVVVMQKRKKRLGEYHPDTLSSMGNLAITYKKQGHWKKAEKLELVVLEKRKEKLGEDHPDTLSSMENLAITYGSQGWWKKAEALDLVVLGKRKEQLGEDHPDTLSSMGNLANTYWSQGQWKKAEVLEVVVWEKRREKLGEDHPDTLSSMGNLAVTYKEQDQWEKAEALEIAIVQKRKEKLGEEHPTTLSSMANLANTYWYESQWKEAEALDLLVLEKRKKSLGEDHPDTLTSMGNLAATYKRQGRWKEAGELEVMLRQKRK